MVRIYMSTRCRTPTRSFHLEPFLRLAFRIASCDMCDLYFCFLLIVFDILSLGRIRTTFLRLIDSRSFSRRPCDNNLLDSCINLMARRCCAARLCSLDRLLRPSLKTNCIDRCHILGLNLAGCAKPRSIELSPELNSINVSEPRGGNSNTATTPHDIEAEPCQDVILENPFKYVVRCS